MTEKDFQAQVVQIAKLNKWLVYHTYDSRKCEPGFPDLVLVRENVLFAELKVGNNKPTPAQRHWLSKLAEAGAWVQIWTDDMMDIIKVILETGGPVGEHKQVSVGKPKPTKAQQVRAAKRSEILGKLKPNTNK